jgi:hypothetical protein
MGKRGDQLVRGRRTERAMQACCCSGAPGSQKLDGVEIPK